MYDIVIRNGNIVDGTGGEIYKADIGIRDDKIVDIGDLHNEKWEVEINATDKIVCPGFIDVNNHSDAYWQIFSNPTLDSLAYQGITTIVGGNCGSSLAPLADAEAILSVQKWSNIKGINLNWLTVKEFLQTLETKKIALNFATLVGHGTLRRGILKDQMKIAEAKELAFIEKMLTQSFKDGAIGMSSGLVYTHARAAGTHELIALAKIIKKYKGIYVTHMRDEREDIVKSIEEAIVVAEEAGVKLHISHLKIMGEKNWHLITDVLSTIEQAKERGVDITFDVYPYTNTGTVLYTLLPNWVTDGGKKMMLERLKDLTIRSRIIDEMREAEFDYAKIDIASSSLDRSLDNRNIGEIAKSHGKYPEEVVVDVLIASEGRVITSAEVLNQKNVDKLILHPLSMIGSNGSGYNIAHAKTGELVHPRSFGAFTRILARYAMGERNISWQEAVKKMTSIPAERFGIENRGKIAKNYFADIVVIDRDEIEDMATTANPYQYSKGVDFVLVNGQVVVADGKHTGATAGEIIRR